MRSSLSSSSPLVADGGSGRIGTRVLVPRRGSSSTFSSSTSTLNRLSVGALRRRSPFAPAAAAALPRPTRTSTAAAAARALPNGATSSGSASSSLRNEAGSSADAATSKPTSTSASTAALLTPQTPSSSSSSTPPVAPPPTPPPPPSLLPILQRFAASLAASLVRFVAAFFSALGGRDFGRRAAALTAGALAVAVASAGAAAGRAVVARSSSSSSPFGGFPPPAAAAAASPGTTSRGAPSASRAAASSPLSSSSAASTSAAAAAAAAAGSAASAAPPVAAAAVRSAPSREVPYSQFLRLVKSGRVRAARLEPSRVVFDVVVGGASPPTTATTASSRRLFGLLPGKKQRSISINSNNNWRTRATAKPLTLSASRLPGDSTTLVPLLLDSGVEFAAAGEDPGSVAARVVAQCLALWLPLSPLLFLMSRALGGRGGAGGGGGPGGAGFGRRAGMRGRGGRGGNGKDQQQQEEQLQRGRVTFADVAGADGAKRELAEAVSALRDPSAFAAIGARAPSGILLYGPPGTGKTLLARAVAGEAGVPFFAVSASEFVELYVGRGAARVRDLFADARRAAPCVVFIDELDAIGARRGGVVGGGFGGGGGGSNDERDQTLNQLLTEMDGFDAAVGVRPLLKSPRAALKGLKKQRTNTGGDGATTDGEGDEDDDQQLASAAASSSTGVLLLAATNRPEVLDPALVRPGRLSRRVAVPLPDEAGRTAVLGVHLAKIRLEGGAGSLPREAARLARVGAGLSGAQLADVANDAALLALRRGATSVASSDLDAALDRVLHGVDGRYGGSANGGGGGGGVGGGAGGGIAKALRGALLSANSAIEKKGPSPRVSA